MNVEYFRQLLQQRPFEPFAVHLSSGETHVVRHPECLALSKTRLVVVEPEEDRIIVCALLHIASVQMLQAAS